MNERLSTFRRWLLLPAGLGVGLWGALVPQAAKETGPMAAAFAVAAVLLGLAVRRPPPEAPPAASPEGPRPWRLAPAVALAGAVLAGALLALALRDFVSPDQMQRRAWMLYVAAVALLAAAFLPWRGSRRPPAQRLRGAEMLALVLILGVAAAFRLHRITMQPYGAWFDEAQNTLEARQILRQPRYRPVFVSGYSQMPALTFYYYAPFVKIVKTKVLGVRLAMTLAGLLSVVAVWALARELFGWRAGLAAAGLLAVSRWHVDFSRFGMAILFPALCIPVTLLLFLRSQRRLSPRDAVLAGVSLGLGMQLYYAMFAVPVLLVATFAHRALTGRSRSLAAAGLLGLTLAATAFTYAPVLQYARLHEAEFSERMRTVSAANAGSLGELARRLLTPSPEQKETLAVLRESAAKHLLMFHIAGDNNGRHNLPGAPMLDPVSGLLFAIGFLWCAAFVFDSRHAMLLLWFAGLISAGILSLAFEAPQGARTCGLTATLAVMGALPLAAVWESVAGEGSRLREAIGACLAAALVAAAGAHSWNVYFGRQLWDQGVFMVFSPIETRIGEVIRDEGGGAEVFLPQDVAGMPSTTLLAGPRPVRIFDRARDLPLPAARKAIVFIHGAEVETAKLLKRFYPRATLEPFGAPLPDGTQGNPLLYIARVSGDELERAQGWETEFRGRSGSVTERTLRTAWDWSKTPLAPPFEARVRGSLQITLDGTYELVLAGRTPATLEVDGETLLQRLGRVRVSLARGGHRIVLTARVAKAEGGTDLLWTTPGTNADRPIAAGNMFLPTLPAQGLLGKYAIGASCDGVGFRQIDPQVAFYFHHTPLPRPFAICWSGSVYAAEAGEYRFGTSSIDGSSVSVDGETVATNPGAGAQVDGIVKLSRGWHAIDVTFRNESDYAQVYLYWTPPGRGREIVPTEVLLPPGPSGARIWQAAPPPAALSAAR